MKFSFEKLFYAIATVFAIFAFMIFAEPILIPLAYALLISFILLPVAQKFESWGIGRIIATLLTMLAVLLLIGGSIFFFSTQIISLAKEFSQIKDKIVLILADITVYINANLNFVPDLEKGEIIEWLKNLVGGSAGYLVGQTFNNTAAFMASLISTIIFIFLIMIYRNGLTYAFSLFFSEENRKRALRMFKSMQQVGKKYLLGMVILILILGSANSIGLLIIGIDNPFLFGFLAALLAIIPYVGTTIGAAIPILYTFVTYDSIWMTVAVIILFWVIQFLEGNFLSPKIVGGSLKINALAAILSIIIGGSMWGIAGMILFLPFAAILKVLCEEYESLRPIGILIGEQNLKMSGEREISIGKKLQEKKDWLLNMKRSKK